MAAEEAHPAQRDLLTGGFNKSLAGNSITRKLSCSYYPAATHSKIVSLPILIFIFLKQTCKFRMGKHMHVGQVLFGTVERLRNESELLPLECMYMCFHTSSAG